jgi:Rrf2 family iron-sulfur cluster assembly transcriptional regulator
MRFSLQVHYAICGVFDLAYNGHGEAVQVRVVGERQAIPPRYLEQIFQRLRRADLVRGKRGPGGGYSLARAADEITLRDIVEAVEGPVGGGGRRWRLDEETNDVPSVHRPDFIWSELSDRFAEVLADLTVDDLCRRAAARGVKRRDALAHTYVI